MAERQLRAGCDDAASGGLFGCTLVGYFLRTGSISSNETHFLLVF